MRIVTDIQPVPKNHPVYKTNPAYKKNDKASFLYEISITLDGVKKKILQHGDTDAFLETINDFEKHLNYCKECIQSEALKRNEKNWFKRHLLASPFYGLAVFLFINMLRVPEVIGMIYFVFSIAIAVATFIIVDSYPYSYKDLKEREKKLDFQFERCNNLRQKCQALLDKKEIIRKNKQNEIARQQAKAQEQKLINIYDLDFTIKRRARNSNSNNFVSDYPKFLKIKNGKKILEEYRNGAKNESSYQMNDKDIPEYLRNRRR